VCQLHTAMAVLIRSWWLEERAASDRLIEKTAKKIARKQTDNAKARKSHTKRTNARLQELGITVSELPRCRWD
jgi:hypothetical protein